MSIISELLKIKPAERDESWEHNFLQGLLRAKARILAPEPRTGPDGWPYLFIALDSDVEGQADAMADEPVAKIVEWLSQRGIGLAINPQLTTPDFVLSYGMVWNCRERGQFLSPQGEKVKGGEIQIQPGQKLLVGPPSSAYLPDYVRKILRDFLQEQKVSGARVAMLSMDEKNYDLGFSLESLNSPPEHERQGIAEALAWFLPAHYSLALVSEASVGAEAFSPL